MESLEKSFQLLAREEASREGAPPRIRPAKTGSRAGGHHWLTKSTRNFEAKIWLESREVAFNYGFASHELNDIEDIIIENHTQLVEAWYEHCGHRRTR
ncbi:hypothetical protein BSZ35_18310 [Salinibacter sp. 10B]|nr:hypothetical protein BSZ35_18310 [Salinibacter sp. 10B]